MISAEYAMPAPNTAPYRAVRSAAVVVVTPSEERTRFAVSLELDSTKPPAFGWGLYVILGAGTRSNQNLTDIPVAFAA
jgi:hypothetical protein